MDVEPTVDETDDVNGLHVSFKEYASNDNVLTEEHIRDIRNAIMSKMNQLEQVKLERFNGKKLKEYEATDTPYQLINKRNNRKCYLIGYDAGVDHDQVCIQEDYYDARKRKQYQFYTVKDMSDFLIWTGGVNVEPGDVIRYSFGKEPGSRESSFYYTYEGISQLDMRGARGMCLYNGMSSTGERFDRFGTWHEIDDEHPIYIAKATKEEYMQYVELMRKNGYRLFEDGRIVALPKVGEYVYAVECDGDFVRVVERLVEKEDDCRLLRSKFTFLTREQAEQVAKRMENTDTYYRVE